MIPPGTRFRRRLTDDELTLISKTCKADGSRAGFDKLWDLILTEAENRTVQEGIARGRTFQVRDYAIPTDQDKQLQRILSVSPSRASRKRWGWRAAGMTFFMYGPATYDE